MRKFYAIFFLIALTVLFLPINSAKANDVWVDHWKSENVDIYVIDNTISSGESNNGRYFKVSVKEVTNGRLQRIVKWDFSQFESGMWRYETDTMRVSRTTPVIPRSGIFEFCMNRLGWSYRNTGNYYY